MSDRYAAFGAIFKRESDTPGTYATIAGVADISGPGMSLDTDDVTAHDSPGAWEEVVGTILRSGEVELELRWDPGDTSQALLRTDMTGRAARNYQIVWPDADDTTWQISALVVGFEPAAPHDGSLGASVSLKVTGEPNFAVAS